MQGHRIIDLSDKAVQATRVNRPKDSTFERLFDEAHF
jgi:hypothetical protein